MVDARKTLEQILLIRIQEAVVRGLELEAIRALCLHPVLEDLEDRKERVDTVAIAREVGAHREAEVVAQTPLSDRIAFRCTGESRFRGLRSHAHRHAL